MTIRFSDNWRMECRVKLDRISIWIANWLCRGAVVSVVGCVLLVGLAFLVASHDGMIPAEWGQYEGNHGPWRHYSQAREPLSQTFVILLYAGGAALISWLLKPGWRSALSFLACLTLFVLEIQFLYWLID